MLGNALNEYFPDLNFTIVVRSPRPVSLTTGRPTYSFLARSRSLSRRTLTSTAALPYAARHDLPLIRRRY